VLSFEFEADPFKHGLFQPTTTMSQSNRRGYTTAK
jgi:hypothetical protein